MSHSNKSRRKRRFDRRTDPGARPGSIVVNPQSPRPVIHAISFGNGILEENKIDDLSKLRDIVNRHKLTWINIDGLGDAQTISKLGEIFNLHPLALEDVVNVHQRPKIEQYTGNLFVVTRMLRIEERLESEQLSIFVGSNYVLTFQEALPGDCFGPLRDRLRNLDPAIHDHGSDYLAYRLLDAVIDSYFPVLEHYGESIDALEEEMLGVHKFLEVARIHAIKQELLQVRRTVWPTRDMLHAMIRDPNPLIKEETKVYLRDCYDHTVQIIDLLETYRELGSDLRDLYLTSVSNRMNEIMKVLTIISTLFIPLTFIVGVYGMNFDPDSSPYNMPELRERYGYPTTWAVMIVIAIGMLIYFVRKGWIGERFWRGKPRKE